MKNIFKVKSYLLVYVSCPSFLNQQINELLKKGWVPFGNPFGDASLTDSWSGQALVKDQTEIYPKNITQYKLICEESAKQLTDVINNHIAEGWLIYGEPFGDSSETTTFLYQAIVKCDDDTALLKN